MATQLVVGIILFPRTRTSQKQRTITGQVEATPQETRLFFYVCDKMKHK